MVVDDGLRLLIVMEDPEWICSERWVVTNSVGLVLQGGSREVRNV